MKKVLAALLILSGVAYGATVITYNIPDAYGLKLLEAVTAQDDAYVRIEIRGHRNTASGDDYYAVVDFRTPPNDPNDSAAVKVKRRVALFASALVKAHEWKAKKDAYLEYQESAPSTQVDAPDPNDLSE